LIVCLHATMSVECSARGWLLKKGKIHRNWLRRYFVLHPSYLEYFTDEKCTQSKGIIPLRNTSCYLPEPSDVNKPFALALQTDKRTYYFQAASQEEVNEWQAAICNTIVALAQSQGLRRQSSVVIEYCSSPIPFSPLLKSLPTPPSSLSSTPSDMTLSESCTDNDMNDMNDVSDELTMCSSDESFDGASLKSSCESLTSSGGISENYNYYDMKAIVSSAETTHGFTAYRIDISWRGYNWTVFRRYRQFDELYGKLESVLGHVKFPSKTLVHNFEDEFVEKRRKMFNRYMRACTNNLSRILGRPNKKKHFFWFIRPFQLGDLKGNTCGTAPFK